METLKNPGGAERTGEVRRFGGGLEEAEENGRELKGSGGSEEIWGDLSGTGDLRRSGESLRFGGSEKIWGGV